MVYYLQCIKDNVVDTNELDQLEQTLSKIPDADVVPLQHLRKYFF
jgi:hypothetical protein